MHTSTCFCSTRWLMNVLSFMSLSSVSPLSSPRAPASSHSDRQEQDQEQQQSSGETQLVTSGSFLNFSKFPTDVSDTVLFVCTCVRMQPSHLKLQWRWHGGTLSMILWRKRCKRHEKWCLHYRCVHHKPPCLITDVLLRILWSTACILVMF